jgi:ankyrin repeat protein
MTKVVFLLNPFDSLFSEGFTPLHLSAQNGDVELCRFFLDSKADLHAKTE